MSAAISFSNIPSNARVPLFHVEFDPSQTGQAQGVKRRLLMGISIGVVPEAPIFVPSLEWAANQYGSNSMLYRMLAAYRANDPVNELWALPVLPNAAGAFASGAYTFSGTATGPGTVVAYVAGQPLPLSVVAGATAASIASALSVLGNAPILYPIPATMSVSGAAVTVTAFTKGLYGNDIDLRLNYRGTSAGEALPPGITCSITPMSGGTLDPVLSSIGAEMGAMAFDYVYNPFRSSAATTAMSAVMSNSAGRWSDNSQLYGHVFTMKSDTKANLITFGGTLNDGHLTPWGLYDSPTPPWEIGAAVLGAFSPAIDNDPARPAQGLPVLGVLAPPPASRFTKADRQQLLTNGIATLAVHDDGSVWTDRNITTWQTNSFGAPSIAYLDAETLFTLMAVTRRLRDDITTTFPRVKIVDDGTVIGPGSASVTPKLLKAHLVASYADMEADGWTEATGKFAAGLLVRRNADDSTRVDVLYDPYLVSGLRIFAVLNQFRLGG